MDKQISEDKNKIHKKVFSETVRPMSREIATKMIGYNKITSGSKIISTVKDDNAQNTLYFVVISLNLSILECLKAHVYVYLSLKSSGLMVPRLKSCYIHHVYYHICV